ncbi:MAG: pentapeptide repeat-containing protein [Cyanobacteria bacterium J06642_2]
MPATIRASSEGLRLIDKARRVKGWAKRDKVWADLVPTSLSTLGRFWLGFNVQQETFQGICNAVGIEDWQSIADFDGTRYFSKKIYTERLSFAIQGSIEKIDKHRLESISALLQQITGDTEIVILDVEEGSIKLTLGGSPESLRRIETLYNSGKLTEVLGISVLDVHILEKNELIQSIKNNSDSVLTLSGANLSGVDLNGTNLSGSDLIMSDLSGSDLSGSDLSGADLRWADLNGANLRETNLCGADLGGADLSEADLRGANLSEADLRGGDISRANLSRANLSWTILRNAFFIGANFRRANLSQANLSGANLSEANIDEADVVRNAVFISVEGVSVQVKRSLQKRGAIFNDPPPPEERGLYRVS